VRNTNPELNPVSFPLASMIVAGIGELAMLEMEQGATEELSQQMNAVAYRMINAVLTGPVPD
jgi:Asp-tRNA(Asn)/Glu-tRNA(Gln) amidotransferase C subunit